MTARIKKKKKILRYYKYRLPNRKQLCLTGLNNSKRNLKQDQGVTGDYKQQRQLKRQPSRI